MQWYTRRRAFRMVLHSYALMAEDAGARAIHPFADPSFLAALAHAGGRQGFGDRTALMRVFFNDVLPDAVLARRSKAHVSHAAWNCHSRRFAASWNGQGVDLELVDPDLLREEWLTPWPHGLASTLMQAAWLATESEPERERE